MQRYRDRYGRREIEEYALENSRHAAHNGAGLFEGYVLEASRLDPLRRDAALRMALAPAATAPSAATASCTSGSMSRASPITATGSRRNTPRRNSDVVNKQGVEVEHTWRRKRRPSSWRRRSKRSSMPRARASRDKNLLNTYVSVQEIERLRDQRLALLSDQIKVTSQFLEILNGQHEASCASTSMRFKPYSERSEGAAHARPDGRGPGARRQRHPHAGSRTCGRSAAKRRPCARNSKATSRASRN